MEKDGPLPFRSELRKQEAVLLARQQLADIEMVHRRQVEPPEHLPASAPRDANWFYAAFHNVTAMMGAGVLALPNAMVYLTWGPGVVLLILSWVITLYTLWQMVEMHEAVPGKRFDRYHELGQEAFGPKLGLWIVVPGQLVVEVGVDIVYMVTAGKSLQHAYDLFCHPHCHANSHSILFWIAIFASVQFALAQLPNFSAIAGISLAAAIMSVGYSTISWAIPAEYGAQYHRNQTVSYALPHMKPGDANSTVLEHRDVVFRIFTALGTVAFAYAGHNVVLEIQATLPSTPQKQSKVAMWRGVKVAYGVVAAGYFPVALVAYWAYGNQVPDDILTFLKEPKWLVAMANIMVVVHVIGAYQIYAMPVYDMLETVLATYFHFNRSWLLQLITRSLYVGFTMFMAMTFPFFSALLGFFGGFAFAPTTYFLPCCMWLKINKPEVWSFSWVVNWICIILGVLLMLVSSIGGLCVIIQEWKTYKPYHLTL